MHKLNKLLEKKRKEKGLSQTDVAKLLGFANGQFISNIERGESELPLKHFRKIARVYDINPNTMIEVAVDDYMDLLKKAVGR